MCTYYFYLSSSSSFHCCPLLNMGLLKAIFLYSELLLSNSLLYFWGLWSRLSIGSVIFPVWSSSSTQNFLCLSVAFYSTYISGPSSLYNEQGASEGLCPVSLQVHQRLSISFFIILIFLLATSKTLGAEQHRKRHYYPNKSSINNITVRSRWTLPIHTSKSNPLAVVILHGSSKWNRNKLKFRAIDNFCYDMKRHLRVEELLWYC